MARHCYATTNGQVTSLELRLNPRTLQFNHEQRIEALVTRLLDGDTLEQLCTDADLPVLVDDTGEPMTVTARTYPDAGVLTLDRGIYLEPFDGSVFGLTVTAAPQPRSPAVEVHLRR